MTDVDPGLTTLAASRPRFEPRAIAELARTLFGLEGELSELPSDRDQNFRIRGAEGSHVLKIAHALEERGVLECQNAVMERAAEREPDLPLPAPVRSLRGNTIEEVQDGERSHLVRVLPYLEGTPLVHVRPHSPQLLAHLGGVLGRLDRALTDFEHPALERAFRWDLRRGLETLDSHAGAIEDAARRELMDRWRARFDAELAPHLDALRLGVVHHDANDHNILVDAAPDGQRIAGLIDFGDLMHGYVAAEPAVAAAYAMLDKKVPLAAARALVRGYHEHYPLEPAEVDALYLLAVLRLCMSVSISALERKEQPDKPYMTVSEAPAWRLLEHLDEVPLAFARAHFRAACGLEPCPNSRAVVEWGANHRGEFAPLLEAAGTAPTPPPVLDLSFSSAVLAELGDDEELDRLDAHVTGMLDGGAAYVVGRYDEARPLYAGALFEGPGEDGPERRTVHLGVDLFAPAGSSVRAPLDGTVHSARDNAGAFDYGPTVVLRHEPSSGPAFFTLYGHLSRESLAQLTVGQEVATGGEVGRMGARSENGGWPPHVHFQVVTDMLGREGEFAGVAAPSERSLWLSFVPNPMDFAGLDPQVRAPRFDDLQHAREHLLSGAMSVSYRRPLTIVRGRMQYLFDTAGRAYLDAVNNVPHVGHSHPRVVRAAREQLATLNTNTRYLHPTILQYAQRLLAKLPPQFEVCFFVCSGSEANELALRLARVHTGARDVLVLEGGYHGNTGALVELSSYKFDGPGGQGPGEHAHVVPLPDTYRGIHRGTDAAERYAEHVREQALACERSGRKLAAFLAEPFIGCGGQIVPPAPYLRDAFEHAREAGAVCIADEVQVGFGRAGSHFWAFETQGAMPDIVTMGKPIANGHPMGAVATTRAIAQSFETGMEYFNTFGGNPVSMAIAAATLDVIEDEGLQENARETGERMRSGLRELQAKHELIGDVRGEGLYIGVDLVLDRETRTPATAQAAYIAERMKDCGILISTDGPASNVLKIKPPMCFGPEDADRLVETLGSILGESCLR